MNHDTLPDAVDRWLRVSSGPQLSVLINQGNGTFAAEQDYALPDESGQPGGGRLQWRRHPGCCGWRVRRASTCCFGQSNGTLGTPVQIDSSLNPTGLAAGSLTTDGRTDLVVADQGYFSYVGSASKSTEPCTSTSATPTAPLPQ